jgi:hypothetical protein
LAKLWPNTNLAYRELILPKPLPTETSVAPKPRGKVVYLPREIARVEESLRESILAACADFERSKKDGDKDYLRALHGRAKAHEPGVDGHRIQSLFRKYEHLFRAGKDIDPAKIKPVMHLAPQGSDWGDLFAIVRSLWSMPYNKGYGRRLRFVIFDEYHESVIGIIGLQSPPADLACRDDIFVYPEGRKLEMVNCTMDAYSIGAIPPYSFLLGGKLCAGLVAADAVRQAYWRQYAGKKTQMENARIRQPLAAVTTTSAFGRSSMYNRLKYKNRLLAEPIGYTLGYGTLHLEHLYPKVRSYLEMTDEYNNGGFGTGPKARWQNLINALMKLGLTNDLLRHGVKREVFIYDLVSELVPGMTGASFGEPQSMTTEEYSEYWLERWALPRAIRRPHWKDGDSTELIRQTIASIPSRKKAESADE